jgi:cytochrome c oxidase subunit 3
MTMTAQEEKERNARSAKLLLLFAMGSMTMMFAAIISSHVISKAREDWDNNYQIPNAFYISSISILLSSITIYFAKKFIKRNNRNATTTFLFLTLILGLIFITFQIKGYFQFVDQNYFFRNDISITFFTFIGLVHLGHLAGGLISLLIIIYNHFKQKYNSSQTLGIELGAMYWHFLDFLWACLFLFLYFFK